MLNIYLISQNINNDYNTYDSAIVAAECSDDAQMIHPSGDEKWDGINANSCTWCDSNNVSAFLIGKAKSGTKKGVLLASYKAG